MSTSHADEPTDLSSAASGGTRLPPDVTVHELRTLAVDLATRAGALAHEMRAESVEVALTKSTLTDVVTRADLAAEALIRDELAQRRPMDGFLGEEGGLRPGTSGLTWVVDPIDGTVNYLYGREHYAVSVAAVLGDPTDVTAWTPVAGCVHGPAMGVTYTAGHGLGAHRNGAPLRMGAAPSLDQALVGTGFSYRPEVRRAQAELLVRWLPLVRDIRRAGAASLDLCDVARGGSDANVELGLHPWDVAAAALVVTEAGGEVCYLDGPLGRVSIAAAPGLMGPLRQAVAD
ncbi:inositol monophosphatase family protein [Serinibacter salmoneus]|uniref:Inositol-1-monophosphatase n=1 Tax=Serinibacter salmoneus TaxID=556530 RepID=A0A2A9CYR5_9MICO|nr:inositol monophosphatase family protein [Serinibacter salmoneus]PFG19543.1 myo-inositol-1(or 4)-monophosphatase [Serinibacter salmoneus]